MLAQRISCTSLLNHYVSEYNCEMGGGGYGT